jgi:Zn-dependent protease
VRASIRFLRWRGIDIGAHWSLLPVAALISWGLADRQGALPREAPGYRPGEYWAAGIATAVAFLVGIAAHELGHAVIAQRRGISVKSITLWLFGGIAQLDAQPTSWQSELSVAVAGPIVSFVIGGLGLGAAAILASTSHADLVVHSLIWLGSTNLLLAGFNLLPGAPLDGGRVFTALRWRHHGDARRARDDGARAGMVVANALIALGLLAAFTGSIGTGLWLAFLGWFLGSAARGELVATETRHVLEGIRIEQVMTPSPVTVGPSMTLETLVTDVLSRVRGTAIPVVVDGQLRGLITPDHLRQVPPREWWNTEVGSIATPAHDVPTAQPAELLLIVLDRIGTALPRVVVLQADGRVVGVVTPTDVARTLRVAVLRDLAAHPVGDLRL